MGFFSWDCKVCGNPLLSDMAPSHPKWMEKVIAIDKDGVVLKGQYDGYGRVNDVEVVYDFDGGNPCCYHEACFKVAGAKEEYVGPSKKSENQGYFFGSYKGVKMPRPPKKAKAKTVESILQEAPKILGADIDRGRTGVVALLDTEGKPARWMTQCAEVSVTLETRMPDDSPHGDAFWCFEVKAHLRGFSSTSAKDIDEYAKAMVHVSDLMKKLTKLVKGARWTPDELRAHYAERKAQAADQVA